MQTTFPPERGEEVVLLNHMQRQRVVQPNLIMLHCHLLQTATVKEYAVNKRNLGMSMLASL